jgi:hypothetical protein
MSDRPWLCPEPRCTPLLNMRDGKYKDITVPEPGHSFFCWGLMAEPVEFVYDGVEHTNDRNFCTYTPLKGVIRLQTIENDWSVIASGASIAIQLANDPAFVDAARLTDTCSRGDER